MTPFALIVSLALSFSAMTALCLSLPRHHASAFSGKPTPRASLALRIAGWAGITLSLAASVAFDGWNFGPVQWIGTLVVGALLVVALLSYRPGWLRPAALAALPLAALAAFAA